MTELEAALWMLWVRGDSEIGEPPSDFVRALIGILSQASPVERNRISEGFPYLVNAWLAVNRPFGFERMREWVKEHTGRTDQPSLFEAVFA